MSATLTITGIHGRPVTGKTFPIDIQGATLTDPSPDRAVYP